MRLRAWLICHTFSSSYSSKASWNCAGVKPRETQRCSASDIRTSPPAPLRPATPSVASSRTREKITSEGRWVLDTRSWLYYTLGGEKYNFLVYFWQDLFASIFTASRWPESFKFSHLRINLLLLTSAKTLTVVRPSHQCWRASSRNWLLCESSSINTEEPLRLPQGYTATLAGAGTS